MREVGWKTAGGARMAGLIGLMPVTFLGEVMHLQDPDYRRIGISWARIFEFRASETRDR